MPYELPKPPPGYRTDLALIVAPYFDLWFTKTLVDALQPQKLRFLLDDGSRGEEVDQLIKECGVTDVEVALGRAIGIVHLKAYYFVFKKINGSGPGSTKRKLLFGSANATRAAFSGSTNAELLAESDLTGDHSDVVGYLTKLVDAIEKGSGSVSGITTKPAGYLPKMALPGFDVVPLGPVPGFDAWVQRGKLVAKYRDAQNFLTATVTLKQPLPRGELDEQFAAQGLIPQGIRNVVRYRYIGSPTVENDDNDDPVAKWKAKYCIWTHLGDWLSEECYRAQRRHMVSKSKGSREAKIKELQQLGQDQKWKAEKQKLFLKTIDGAWRTLREAHLPPEEYFEGTPTRADHSHYRARFSSKLSADFLLAQDENFCERYINGYEFLDVPRFRQDTIGWREFIRSWCESVAIEADKIRTTNSLITRACQAILQEDLRTIENPEEIADEIRLPWNFGDPEAPVWAKWEDDYFYRGQVLRISEKSGRRIFVGKYDGDDSRFDVETEGIRSCGDRMTKYYLAETSPYDRYR
jgi:hypothetical protein